MTPDVAHYYPLCNQPPTLAPTDTPTDSPTQNPTDPTPSPTDNPTKVPTHPTASPTDHPTDNPTASPTDNPTPSPTDVPTASPTSIIYVVYISCLIVYELRYLMFVYDHSDIGTSYGFNYNKSPKIGLDIMMLNVNLDMVMHYVME